MGKSEYSCAILEVMYFYDLGVPGTYDAPNYILQDTRRELFKTHKTGTVLGKS
jgi:hypothetical protein